MEKKALDRAGALGHVLRLEVMAALSRRPASAAEVAEEIGVPVDSVRYQLKRLREAGLIEGGGERQRRGTVERSYVTLDRETLLDREEFADLPEEVKKKVDAHLLKVVFRETLRALAAGTMSARDDSSIVRSPMAVDAQGWKELAAIQVEAFERIQAVKEQSWKRLEASGEDPIQASSILMLFEVPPSD